MNKRAIIGDNVAGRSFVDIGGLWGTKGEVVTTAIAGGASRAVMADFQQLGSGWWEKFDAHCAKLGVYGYEKLWVDICAPDAADRLGRFDFVHCSGIMYHVADLFQFVGNLVSVTNELLLLSSVVMPSRIETASGVLEFSDDCAYLTPILSAPNKKIIVEYLSELGVKASGLTIESESIIRPDGKPKTGPWWWLFSGEFMSRLVGLYGFKILSEGYSRGGRVYTVFAHR